MNLNPEKFSELRKVGAAQGGRGSCGIVPPRCGSS